MMAHWVMILKKYVRQGWQSVSTKGKVVESFYTENHAISPAYSAIAKAATVET
jgi:hypothetical protein